MVDHGGDAATVIANAATDITKGVLQISASGLKQLFLLMYEGKQIKIGQTNIEKLINMIDAGDSINDITVPKEHMNKFVELSNKHGVTYAVVENPDGKMVVYFPQSQLNRMQNVIKDIQNDINRAPENEKETDSEKVTSTDKEVSADSEIKEENSFLPEIKNTLYTENVDSKRTVVFFDGNNPNHYIRISQEPSKTGECETRIFAKYDDGITELVSTEKAAHETFNYEKRMHFEVEGLYPESKIEEHINKVCTDLQLQEKAKELIQEKENIIDNLLAKNSSLEGSIYTIYDAENKKNMIVIQKELKPFEGGEFQTVNQIMVFNDGELTKDMTPKQAILSYEKYKTMDKHGKSADRYYEKITSGELFKDSKVEENKTNPDQRKSLSEYEKDVERIKELEPKKPEAKELTSQAPLKLVKEVTEKGER